MRRVVGEMMIGVLVALAVVRGAAQESGGEAPRFGVAGFDRDSDALIFFRRLKQAVADDQRDAVAAMIRYPVEATIGQCRVTLRNRSEFLKRYPEVFTACFRRIIAEVGEHELWAKWSGVSLPRGQLWFAPDEAGRVAVIAINGPFLGEKGCNDLTTQH